MSCKNSNNPATYIVYINTDDDKTVENVKNEIMTQTKFIQSGSGLLDNWIFIKNPDLSNPGLVQVERLG